MKIIIDCNDDTIEIQSFDDKIITSYKGVKNPYQLSLILLDVLNLTVSGVASNISLIRINEDSVKQLGEW